MRRRRTSEGDQAAQARWQAGVPRWRADMLGALNQISLLLSNSGTVADLHTGRKPTLAKLERYEQRLEDCAAAIASSGRRAGGARARAQGGAAGRAMR